MSICTISDHIIMLGQNFIIILSILKPKSEGRLQPPPRSAPDLYSHVLSFFTLYSLFTIYKSIYG